ncbi:MAG: SGNH/GDSL hydrolase family protein, partial [Candidatus Methanoperedens sp.]|nr:SGNH/GDSL hydrolase family protein [Candidatus Methanoperedens sp.]
TFYVSDSVTSSTNYNWTHQTNTTYVFVVEPFMDKPYMAFIGDSIISGFPEHLSFLQNEDVTDIQASIENKWSRKVDKSYQNMGFGGDTTGKLNSRFISDVVDLSPEFVLIEGGINDINAYPVIDYTTTLDNWESMIQKASNKKITPVIMLILPDSRATNERSDNISYMNEQLIKLANLYSPSIVVDARCYIGVQRASGPPGNCWDIDRKYTGDGLHYNSIGNERIAQAIKDSFRFVYGKEGLYNLIQPDGTIIYSTSLSDATNISLRMASTTGTANVSLNMPAAGEYANITIYSGTIGLINIDNLSPNQCDLLSSDSMNIETKVAMNGNIRFTKKLPSGTYSIRCNIPPAIIVWNSSRTNGKSLSLSVNVSENVNFSAIADQAITSWDWEYDGIYSVSRTNNDFTASWADPGLKTIRVFAENQNGTSNIITWEVNVTAKSNQTMNNPQDVNGSRGGSVNMSSSEKPGSGGSTLNALISSIVALPIKLKFLIVFFLLTIAIMFGDYVKSK